MLEGGGHINGSFLSEGLIDELNLLVLPVVDGNKKNTSVFEVHRDQKKKGATLMKLKSMKKIKGGVVWLKYKL
jgi:riboflavin biosynthesis pyrimidine reductase